ncbi:MAG: acyltransferase family protein [Myxococcales bacterium]|nr:acyltransferase family protein [Myxococcales bacterium]
MAYDIDSLEHRDPARIAQAARWVLSVMKPWHRAEARGLERIPSGAALYVGNHSGGPYSGDTFLFFSEAFVAHGLDAVPYALAHEVFLRMPGLRHLVSPLGAVRASHENAMRILARGSKVLVYPGGELDSLRPYRERNRIVFGDRCGYIRLALRARVPIVPVVAAGAHSTLIVLDDMRWLARALGTDRWMRLKALPLALSVPWGLTIGFVPPYIPLPARIVVEALEPVHFTARVGGAEDEGYVAECDARVRDVMQATLTRLAAE